MRARKRFGQHFLESVWVRKLVQTIRPAPKDRFFEIGAGRGALTFPLAEAGARVLALEIDRDLAAELARAVPPTVQVIARRLSCARRTGPALFVAAPPTPLASLAPIRPCSWKPSLQHLLTDPVPAAEAAARHGAVHRRVSHASAGSCRPLGRAAWRAGLRAAGDRDSAPGRRPSRPRSPAWSVSAPATGPLGRGQVGLPARAGSPDRTRSV